MMKASQNVGADTPISDTTRATWSIHESRFIAASTPSGRPNTSDSRKATVDSSIVAGRVLRDVLDHRALRGDRDAEIAVRQATQKNPVAVPHRQVEAPFVPVGRDDGGIVGGDVAKLGQHRIARHRVGDQEDDQRGQQHHRRGNHQTRGDVAQHAMVSLPLSSHNAWRRQRQVRPPCCHCERSKQSPSGAPPDGDCFAALAMTVRANVLPARAV